MQESNPQRLLELKTDELLAQLGGGNHVPGSGSAAALLGLISCKMMQTVVAASRRNRGSIGNNMSQLEYIDKMLMERDEPFFREAVQNDAEQFDLYFRANQEAKRKDINDAERKRLGATALEKLKPATEIPLSIAHQAIETAERGLLVFDLGVRHTRGDSGVAVSAALSSCSGALFIVYLNLLKFREGEWAQKIRSSADELGSRYQRLQIEQFTRTLRIQAEGVSDSPSDPQLNLGLADNG